MAGQVKPFSCLSSTFVTENLGKS